MAFRPPPVLPLTDGSPAAGASHAEQAEVLLQAGMRCIQVRDKSLDDAALLAQLDSAVAAARRHHGLVLVNDRPDLALLCGAGGVHLGEGDLPLPEARQILGPSAVLGRSSHDPASARAAEKAGADYVAFGPVYATDSKPDARPAAGLEQLRQVRKAVSIPLVAIGGITLARAGEVFAAGADSVALIRDLAGAPDVAQRARQWQESADAAETGPRGLLFVTGFMGAGKSTVGRRVARQLGRRFVDLDTEIERRQGMTVAEIFRIRGEPAFRECEAALLARFPAGADAVVALGGGTLLQEENLRAVQQRGALVWLQCSLEQALARCDPGSQRPLLRTADAGKLLQQRLPGYEAAQLMVDATRSVDLLAEQITAWVHAGG